jgi:hypothetical protein
MYKVLKERVAPVSVNLSVMKASMQRKKERIPLSADPVMMPVVYRIELALDQQQHNVSSVLMDGSSKGEKDVLHATRNAHLVLPLLTQEVLSPQKHNVHLVLKTTIYRMETHVFLSVHKKRIHSKEFVLTVMKAVRSVKQMMLTPALVV